MEGGREGGRVVVRQRSDENLFDLAESSSRCFYLNASYSNCALDLEEVTFGWRLAIVIGLELFETLLSGTSRKSLSGIPPSN